MITCPDCDRLISARFPDHDCVPRHDALEKAKEASLGRGLMALQNRSIRESEGKGYLEMRRRARQKLGEEPV